MMVSGLGTFLSMKRRPRGHRARLATGMAAMALAAACWEYDKGEGTFNLSVTGGLDGSTTGHAEAAHANEFSGLGYYVAFDFSNGSRPVGNLTRLVLWTTSRPSRPGRFPISEKLAATNAGVANADVSTTDPVVTWTPDSGAIDFKQPASKHGSAGEFTIFASCPRCGPGDAPSHIVMRGSFKVQ